MGEGQIEVSWVASARDLGPPNPALQRTRPAAEVSGIMKVTLGGRVEG